MKDGTKIGNRLDDRAVHAMDHVSRKKAGRVTGVHGDRGDHHSVWSADAGNDAGQRRCEVQSKDAQPGYEILLGGDQVSEAVCLIPAFDDRNP